MNAETLGLAALALGGVAGLVYALGGKTGSTRRAGILGALGGAASVLAIQFVHAAATPRPEASMPMAARALHGRIALAPGVTVARGTTLFVIARPEGQLRGQPIAVRRLEAVSFPMEFALTDQDSMTGAPLPDRVLLQIRADADGDPMTRGPDDASGWTSSVATGGDPADVTLKPEAESAGR